MGISEEPSGYFEFSRFDVSIRRLMWQKPLHGVFDCPVWYLQKSYLVDPASSHMLVSKIKPCMSEYKYLYTVKLRTAH